MNYTEAMNEARSGKKITRESWLGDCFLRAEKFEPLAVTEDELSYLKKQIFVSVLHGETMEMRFLFYYYGKYKTFYAPELLDITAEDWRVYGF
jgi:hypothetical protein